MFYEIGLYLLVAVALIACNQRSYSTELGSLLYSFYLCKNLGYEGTPGLRAKWELKDKSAQSENTRKAFHTHPKWAGF